MSPKVVRCPATGEACPSQEKGSLAVNETCEGPLSRKSAAGIIELCGRQKPDYGRGASPLASKLMEDIIKKTMEGES